GNYPRKSSRANRLTKELWDTRRQIMTMQAREKVILEDLDELGVGPQIPASDGQSLLSNQSSSARAVHTRFTEQDDRTDVPRLKAELQQERTNRIRAESALHDVERECRAPFVVPALLQAFLSISELSS
ncbi:hypothetical protein BS17DRAFT_706581, partial [Gyrodon lividus]